jgi:chromosome segregation ATPase
MDSLKTFLDKLISSFVRERSQREKLEVDLNDLKSQLTTKQTAYESQIKSKDSIIASNVYLNKDTEAKLADLENQLKLQKEAFQRVQFAKKVSDEKANQFDELQKSNDQALEQLRQCRTDLKQRIDSTPDLTKLEQEYYEKALSTFVDSYSGEYRKLQEENQNLRKETQDMSQKLEDYERLIMKMNTIIGDYRQNIQVQ